MRTFFALGLILLAPQLRAQSCSPAASAQREQTLSAAQHAILDVKYPSFDSGVPPQVAPAVIQWKAALATAVDGELGCYPPSDSEQTIASKLTAFLHNAAPGVPLPANGSSADDDGLKPVANVFGNEVSSSVSIVPGPPRLLQVALDSSVPCGSDSQLLIYAVEDGRWHRTLRWTSDFTPHNGAGFAWGDMFLTGILTPDTAHPQQWRAVVAHGTPWCTSRFSSFGMAVLAPVPDGSGARVIWQTDRGYSRSDFEPRLRASRDTFELRLHADEMQFNDSGFERLVVYRYKLHEDQVFRIEPLAANGRGFVEEWLSSPWKEALAQSNASSAAGLESTHRRFEASYKQGSNDYLSWAAGPVQGCSVAGRFQVTFTTEQQIFVQGTPGGKTIPGLSYYFQLEQVPNGYRMLSVSEKTDPNCNGPDLMQKASK